MKLFIPFIIVLSGFLLFVSCQSKQDVEKPNIVLLVSEDNSPFLGCYGDEFAHTPHLDKLAENSVRYTNAFANAPVCAPSRSTLVTGMYANSLGTHHMRSTNDVPERVRFFPYYLKKQGYYTVNRYKKDYNTYDQDSVWDYEDWWEWKDVFKGRQEEQPFFIQYNTFISHEGKIHDHKARKEARNYFINTMVGHGADSVEMVEYFESIKPDPQNVPIPPYHPETDEMKTDWANYYTYVQLMDKEIGYILKKLKETGEYDNTIIFYFSDHGGVLGRSKRFIFESGLKVPFIVHLPEKYEHLIQYDKGTTASEVISFVDIAPTLLRLAGSEIPDHMQGKAFLGNPDHKGEYAFGFRGRMDERYEMVRSVRSKKFRYTRNYMPHRIYGGHVQYLFRAASMRSWEKAYEKGECNDVQARFWEPKHYEELYEIGTDPHNVKNLAQDPDFQNVKKELSTALQDWIMDIRDAGFVPEAEMVYRTIDSNPYELLHSDDFPFHEVVRTANKVTLGKAENLDFLLQQMKHDEPSVRYWAATGCAILGDKATRARGELIKLLKDESVSVRIAAAEALYLCGDKDLALKALGEVIKLPTIIDADSENERVMYANHLAVTHALNVMDTFDEADIEPFMPFIKEIAELEKKGNANYDARTAQDIVKKMNY